MPIDAMPSSLNARFEGGEAFHLAQPTRHASSPICRMAEWSSRRVKISSSSSTTRRALAWDGMAAEIVETMGNVRAEYRLQAEVHLLAVSQGELHARETYVEGLPRSRVRDLQGRITIVPAGCRYHDTQETRGLTRTLFVYLDPATSPLSLGFLPRLNLQDTLLFSLSLRLRKIIEESSSNNQRYLQALGLVMAGELDRLDAATHRSQPLVHGGLATWQKLSVVEYIDEHLAEHVPLRRLAGLARLSSFHFSRAFKQSFGVPPHRYHLMRRIELSKTLLAARKMSVSEIGMAVGFGEASAFTATFRRMTGVTPTVYSRSVARAPD